MNRFTPRVARRSACWLTFVLALIVYLLTLEPDASLWDCPEYLVTAARLEVGHPPGNPVWTLTARIFSIFGGSDPGHIAVAVILGRRGGYAYIGMLHDAAQVQNPTHRLFGYGICVACRRTHIRMA